jgi:hypothetical protein
MADHPPPNEMAGRLATRVRDARFAKGFAEALTGFGGRMGSSTSERLMLWRRAMPSPFRPAPEFPSPNRAVSGEIVGRLPPIPRR